MDIATNIGPEDIINIRDSLIPKLKGTDPQSRAIQDLLSKNKSTTSPKQVPTKSKPKKKKEKTEKEKYCGCMVKAENNSFSGDPRFMKNSEKACEKDATMDGMFPLENKDCY